MTTIDITAVSKLKHAELWKAAKSLGGQSALGRYLGVRPDVIGRWCNLQDTPHHTGDERDELEKKLYAITGKTLDELFPRELCEAEEFLRSKKTIESTKEIELSGLLEYAERTQERLTLDAPNTDTQELLELIKSQVDRLSYREREIIKLRYGLKDGYRYTLEEVGHIFKVTRERIRSIESRAIRRLQEYNMASGLVDFAPERTGPLKSYQEPIEVWPSERHRNEQDVKHCKSQQ